MVEILQIIWSVALVGFGLFAAVKFAPRYRAAWRVVWGERGWWLFLLPGLLIVVAVITLYVAVFAAIRDWWRPRSERRWAEMHRWAESDDE